MHENRETSETPAAQPGRRSAGEGPSHKARAYVSEESHNGIVPMNHSNKDGKLSAESGEGRPLIKENARQSNTYPTQSGKGVSQGLAGVRKAARENKGMKFTALLHHLTVDLLRESFYSLKRKAAPGVDGVTWQEYEDGLEDRLVDLHGRVHRGAYRAVPSRRVYIEKEDGRKRPLGVAALEDKIVQQAVATILNQIYEEDFLGFSYGFRPGRSQHQALDALSYALLRRKVNYVLDADIRGFFDNLDKSWMIKFSRILANIFLHYAFDLWMERTHPDLPWRRYADNGLVHCHNEQEAQALKAELQTRLAECCLEMHPTKTKIVYCKDKKRQGVYPNVKFDFLGYCFRPRLVRRFRDNTLFCGFNPAVSSSAMKAMRSTIRELKLRHQTQLSLQAIARQLNPLLRGWIEYYGRYAPSALYPLLRHVNQTLVAWAMRKFKRFKDHKVRASQFLQRLATEHRSLFVHWDIGMTGVFA